MKRRPEPARLGGLHVLADDDPRWPRDPVAQAQAAAQGGAAVVQLRAKHAVDGQILEWACAIRELTRRSGALFFVNDRFDLALAAEADGVHLGQDDLPPGRLPVDARAVLLVGRSTHTEAEVESAANEPVDYVAFGPVFGTRSKDSPYPAPGTRGLAQAVEKSRPRPVVAIGGIDASNAGQAMAAGAAGIAVISAVAGASDPVEATRSLVRSLQGAAP